MDDQHPSHSRRQFIGAVATGLVTGIAADASAGSQPANQGQMPNPVSEYPKGPFPKQQQEWPGLTGKMTPRPDHGESSYKGSGKLTGRRALITGGDSGIGRAVAIAFAREGADVLVAYLEETEDAQETGRLIEQAGRRAVLVAGDVSDPAHCREIVDRAVAELGGVDILVNNAAVAGAGVLDGNSEDWRYSIETNLLGYIVCTREAIDRMRKRGAGHIVNVGSMSADQREPENDVYAATKAAVQALSESLRKSVNKENIRITLVEPGAVATPMHEKSPAEERQRIQQKKMLTADDIARCVVFCLEQPDRMDVVAVQVRPLMQLI